MKQHPGIWHVDNFVLQDCCSVQYHMTICWRLLSCLPPSEAYLTSLLEDIPPGPSSTTPIPAPDTHLLHTLRWVPRLTHNKGFRGWTKVEGKCGKVLVWWDMIAVCIVVSLIVHTKVSSVRSYGLLYHMHWSLSHTMVSSYYCLSYYILCSCVLCLSYHTQCIDVISQLGYIIMEFILTEQKPWICVCDGHTV